MKSILLSCALLVTTLAFGQGEKYKAIPGTKVRLIPPTGFSPSAKFPGFQHDKAGASIMVTELPAPLQTTTEGFTADALQAKGMQLIDKQAIDFQGGKATFIKVSQQANGQTYLKQLLLFGDNRKTIMINGVYPETSKGLEKDIRAALVSTAYTEGGSADPLEASRFRIDVSGTPFRFAKNVTGSLLYTTDGEAPTKAADRAVIVVANSFSNVATANRRQFCMDRLKKLPRGASLTAKSVTPINVPKLNGYEIVAEGKDASGKAQLVYQVMLFDEQGGYYLLVGTASHNEESYLTHFRTITQSFQLK